MSRLLALLTAMMLGLAWNAPLLGPANPTALQMLVGWLTFAFAGSLAALVAPALGSWLTLGGVAQVYFLVPLATPLVGTMNPYWGDSRYFLVAWQATAAVLLGLRAVHRGHSAAFARLLAALYLSVPAGLHLLERPSLFYFGVEILLWLILAGAPFRVTPPIPGDPPVE